MYRGRYARTCAIGDETGWITVEDDPAKSRLLLTVSESLAPHVAQLTAKTRRLFDTDCLPGEVSHALSGFHRQAGERYRIEGIRLPCSFGGFEMSVRAIIGQQITVKAANTLAGRLAQRFGMPCDTPFEGLDTVFPDPSAFANDEAVEAMGELGIIKRRAQAIRLLAEGFADGSLEWGAGCDAQQSLQKLVALPGIGPWTANYLLMRAIPLHGRISRRRLRREAGLSRPHAQGDRTAERGVEALPVLRRHVAVVRTARLRTQPRRMRGPGCPTPVAARLFRGRREARPARRPQAAKPDLPPTAATPFLRRHSARLPQDPALAALPAMPLTAAADRRPASRTASGRLGRAMPARRTGASSSPRHASPS